MATLDKDAFGSQDSTEKYGANHVDDTVSYGSDSLDHDPEFSIAEQRSIIHRVDRRLITTCGIMYCVSLMDRTNLSAAAIAGMSVKLELNVGFRYSTIALVFFITYVLCQPPATILCRKIGPRPFLAVITLAWGIVIIGFGFPKTWVPMIPLRLILGVLEAGFFPGCVYLITLSGILAFGLMQMSGLAGYSGWRWIFIMEGILTCLIATGGYFALRECNLIVQRVNKDRDDAHATKFDLGAWAKSGLDIKIWGFAMIFFCLTTCTYAIAYFLPIILHSGMGYSIGASQCLVAPPYALAGVLMFCTSWFGDKYHMRGPILIFNAMLALIGLPIMGFHSNNGVRYFGIFLLTAGANANISACMAYQANNIRGQWKRAFASATLVGFGGIGGIAGSLVFRAHDAPLYRPGIYAAITANCLIIVIVVCMSLYFEISNRKAEKGVKVIEDSEGFRYTI